MSDQGLYPVPEDLGLGATVRGFIGGQRLFDRYVLRHILGRGGMGVVWLAHDEMLERDVALKFLPELVTLDKEAIADLKRETRRSLELTHPHIVRIYDFVQDKSWAGISMEYIQGQTLSGLKVDQPHGHFEVETLRPWVMQLCEALTYAHVKAKVVHRDLKPANLMINAESDLKVADFGIARSVSDSVSRVTMRAGASGTLAYMSPQQALGQTPKVTDEIYALGATLYELLTGKPPFHRGDIVTQVREIVPPSMTERRAELEIAGEKIPEAWEQTIAACLAKDPANRPQTVKEVVEQLGRSIAPSAPSVATPRKKPVSSPRGPKNRRHLFIGAALVAFLLLGGLAYHFGIATPAEKARRAEIVQQEADAKAAAAEAKKQKADAAAQQAEAQAKSEQEKAALEKAKQEAEAQKVLDDAAKAKALADRKAADAAQGNASPKEEDYNAQAKTEADAINAANKKAEQKPPVAAQMPTEAQDAFNKGIIAAKQQEWDMAIQYFQDARKKAPDAPEIYYNLGLAESQIPGRELLTLACFGTYLTANPTTPKATEIKGQIDMLDVKCQSTISKLLQIMEDSAHKIPENTIDPKIGFKWIPHDNLINKLGRLSVFYAAIGNTARASELAEKATSFMGSGGWRNTTFMDAWFTTIVGMRNASDASGLKKMIDDYLDKSPDAKDLGTWKAEAFMMLGVAQYMNGEEDEGAASLAKSREYYLSEKDEDVYLGMIRDDYTKYGGNLSEARKTNSSMATNSHADDVMLMVLSAQGQFALGRSPNAYVLLMQARDLAKDNDSQLRTISYYFAACGNLPGALKTASLIKDEKAKFSETDLRKAEPFVQYQTVALRDWQKLLDDPNLDDHFFLKLTDQLKPSSEDNTQKHFYDMEKSALQFIFTQKAIDQLLVRQARNKSTSEEAAPGT